MIKLILQRIFLKRKGGEVLKIGKNKMLKIKMK